MLCGLKLVSIVYHLQWKKSLQNSEIHSAAMPVITELVGWRAGKKFVVPDGDPVLKRYQTPENTRENVSAF